MKVNWYRVLGCVLVGIGAIGLAAGGHYSGPGIFTCMTVSAMVLWCNEDRADKPKAG